MTMDEAIVDSSDAWSQAQGYTLFHAGNSKTNMLYWIATRPGATRNTSMSFLS